MAAYGSEPSIYLKTLTASKWLTDRGMVSVGDAQGRWWTGGRGEVSATRHTYSELLGHSEWHTGQE